MEYFSRLLSLAVLLLHCSIAGSQTAYDEGYFGCFNDNEDTRAFPWWQPGDYKLKDPVECRKICQNHGFTMAGFTGDRGKDCHCGNWAVDRRKVADANCQSCSQGGYRFKCGSGGTKMAVYRTEASLIADRRFVGCWKGQNSPEEVFLDTERVDVTAELTRPSFTVTECMSTCFGKDNNKYKYIGIAEEKYCWCGVKPVSKNNIGPAKSSMCDSECPGFHEKSSCGSAGGPNYISIYRIDRYVGCYKANTRDHFYTFWDWPSTYNGYSAGRCINYCRSKSFKFAVLTSGSQLHCYCGNYGMELRWGGYSNICSDTCSASGEVFFCASRSAVAVYETLAMVEDERYMACYSGNAASFLGAYHGPGSTSDKEECLGRCRDVNRPYAAWTPGGACHCGNAMFYRQGTLQRAAGEQACSHYRIYWAACMERGKYKKDCTGMCRCYNYEICDPSSGNCPDLQCTAGFTKDPTDTSKYKSTCQKVCESRKFGRECSQTCHCLNDVACDAESGECPEKKCDPYWTGDTCSDPITCSQYRKYGPDCTADCNCYGNADCNDQTGVCQNNQCRVGKAFDDQKRCTQDCPDNTYGKDCAGRCFCDGPSCNKIDGSCPSRVCKKGYSSNRCNIMNVDELLVGCFNDDPQERVLFWWPNPPTDHTAKECMQLCFDQNYKFAGLSKEGTNNWCFCGNFGFESRGASSKCTTCTKGSETFPCAPSDSIAVFNTYGSGKPDERFLGCWVAPPQIIGIGIQPRFKNPKTVEDCIEECRTNNYKYSALKNGTECYCGNDLQRVNGYVTSNTACSTLCEGYNSVFDPSCGGPTAVSVYRAVCEKGTYGSSCQFPCRCENERECSNTGECPNRRCKEGYRYNAIDSSYRCTIPCTQGQFGVNCEGRCYCKDGVDCDKITGECPDGCLVGFQGLNCSITKDRFVGCFRDNIDERSFFWWMQTDYLQKTAADCIEQCFRNGFKYAALTDANENECSCGNSGFGQYGLSVDCYTCNRSSKSFTCAPRGAMAVYHTFLSPEPPDLRHIGCWTGNQAVTQVLDPVPLRIFDNQGDLTVDYCCTECAKRGYRYAGLAQRQDCHCGNNLQRSTNRWPDSPSQCDQKCLGDDVSSPPCGGPRNSNRYISVYRAECKIGKWGSRCEKACNCWEQQRCNNSLGTCPLNRCAEGWLLSSGQTCSKQCSFRTFGLSCEQVCHCAKNTGCNNVTGQCDVGYCDPGYRGTSCSQRCDYEFYGTNCSYQCNCGAQECNHITGACGGTSNSPRINISIELLLFSLVALIFTKTLTLLKPTR